MEDRLLLPLLDCGSHLASKPFWMESPSSLSPTKLPVSWGGAAREKAFC
jgi:hypothetical protein